MTSKRALEAKRLVMLKLERAKDHQKDLLSQVGQFWKDYPPRIEVIDDHNAKQRKWIARLGVPPAEDWALIVGDIVHNLRSALDHLVCRLVESEGNRLTTNTAFPIAESEAGFRKIVRNKTRGVSANTVLAITELRPWPGGNDDLHFLHQIDINDKHKLLLPVIASYDAMVLDFGALMRSAIPGMKDIPSMPLAIQPEDREVKDGTVLYIEPLDRLTGGDPKFRFEVDLLTEQGSHPLGVRIEALVATTEQTIELLAEHLGG